MCYSQLLSNKSPPNPNKDSDHRDPTEARRTSSHRVHVMPPRAAIPALSGSLRPALKALLTPIAEHPHLHTSSVRSRARTGARGGERSLCHINLPPRRVLPDTGVRSAQSSQAGDTPLPRQPRPRTTPQVRGHGTEAPQSPFTSTPLTQTEDRAKQGRAGGGEPLSLCSERKPEGDS